MSISLNAADADPESDNQATSTTHKAWRQRRVLFVLNLVACALHAALAVSAIVSTLDKGSVEVPTFTPASQWNVTSCAEQGYGVTTTVCPADKPAEEAGVVNFSAVLICSQLITAVFHGVLAFQSRDPSSRYIVWSYGAGIKVFHWLEYVVTASLISHIVLYFSGVIDLRAQVLGYAAQSALMLIGMLQDLLRHCCICGMLGIDETRVLVVITFVIGFFNVLSVWGPSLHTLFIDEGDAEPPSFVKWVVLAEATLYTSFGIAQLAFFVPLLVHGRNLTTRFFEEEAVFVILSFVAKATLASAFSACLVYQACGQ